MDNNFRVLLENTELKEGLTPAQQSFVDNYIGKEVSYDDTDVDYENLFDPWNYDNDCPDLPEDCEEFEKMRKHCGLVGTIVSAVDAEYFVPNVEDTNLLDKSAFDGCFWNVKFSDGYELEGVSGQHLILK